MLAAGSQREIYFGVLTGLIPPHHAHAEQKCAIETYRLVALLSLQITAQQTFSSVVVLVELYSWLCR